jgi:hypothetical protein
LSRTSAKDSLHNQLTICFGAPTGGALLCDGTMTLKNHAGILARRATKPSRFRYNYYTGTSARAGTAPNHDYLTLRSLRRGKPRRSRQSIFFGAEPLPAPVCLRVELCQESAWFSLDLWMATMRRRNSSAAP